MSNTHGIYGLSLIHISLLEKLAAACAEEDAGDDVPPSAGRRDALRAPATVMPRTRALARA